MDKMYRTLPENGQLPYALYTAEQVRNLDRLTIEQYGIAGAELMERAGQGTFELMLERWPTVKQIAIFCGSGNNGGDGYVIARLAVEQGIQVTLYQLGDCERLLGDALLNYQRLPDAVELRVFDGRLPASVELIVDAMLGTGLNNPVKGAWLDAINLINQSCRPVLAVDIPSGLSADSGCPLGAAIKADLTVTFIGLKRGLFTSAGREYCGEIMFRGLQVPARVYASEILSARRVDWRKIRHQLKTRSRNAHKGHFGHLLLVGGAPGYAGAIRLAAEAALRSGAGLVSVATHPDHASLLNTGRPEIMVHAAASADAVSFLLKKANAVVIGPGLGQSDNALAMLQTVLAARLPTVLDADALNLLAANQALQADCGPHLLITPHPGEAARLLGLTAAGIEADRFAAIEQLRRRFDCQVILKGAGSLIIDARANQPVAVCSDGNPGMASGGMGDVLAGLCGSLLAQHYDADEAALLGCCLHAAAGDLAARQGETGLLASDLFVPVRQLINQLDAQTDD
jgi:hydroxyethylthiazole kinase-like uncharacterized protein yjeF